MSERKSRSTRSQSWFALLAACTLVTAALADDATTKPSTPGVIAVGDKAALEAAKDQDVTIEGVCDTAEWSGSGKVMNLSFAGTDQTHVEAVVFSKNKQKLDEAFSGDAAKAFRGATLRIKGKLREYGGKVAGRKGHPEITITDPSQVTIVSAPTSQPTSQPAR